MSTQQSRNQCVVKEEEEDFLEEEIGYSAVVSSSSISEDDIDYPLITEQQIREMWDGSEESRKEILSRWFHKRDGRTLITPLIARVITNIKCDEPINNIKDYIKKYEEYVFSGGFRNRNLQETIILKRMIKDMSEGNWQLNGVTIVFSTLWDLINGHHRIATCILSNVNFMTCYSTQINNLYDQAWLSTDNTPSRTILHAAQHLGYENPSEMSLSADMFYKYINCHPLNNRNHEAIRHNYALLSEYAEIFPLLYEVIDFLKEKVYSKKRDSDGDLRDYVTKKAALFAFTIFATCEMEVRGNWNLTKEFIERLHYGRNISTDCPIKKFRQLISGYKLRGSSVKMEYRLHYLSKTFIFWLENRQVQMLRSNKKSAFANRREIKSVFRQTSRSDKDCLFLKD